MALDPVVLGEELSLLPDEVRQRLMVDARCSLVSPMDKELDEVLEKMRGESAIGTTRRGIGPSYAIRALRLSPRVSDLVAGFDFGPLTKFYETLSVDAAGLISWAEESKRLLQGMLGNVGGRVMEINGSGGSVLFEGSQGFLLDLLHGSYPYVTSTHTSSAYIPSALGIPPSSAGKALGVVKCYTTRVGGGPFPTELKGQLAEKLRSLGNEYGATTGRPRRVGWLDLVALKYAVSLNGAKEVVLTKLDVLSQLSDFKVCVAYRQQGSETADFQSCLGHLGSVEPVYESPLSLHGAEFDSGLPAQGKKFVDYLEKELGAEVSLVSYGEERSRTIEL